MLRCVLQSFIFTGCALALAAFSSHGAWAQTATVLPSYTVVDLGPLNLDKGEPVVRDPQTVFKDISNDDMRKTLLLQNQITMINALTNWQSQVTKMEETYLNAGLPFYRPKPPRYICEQVPPNTVCGDAYADLAPEPDVLAALPIAPSRVPSDLPDPRLKKTSQKTPVMEETPVSYSWTDIKCKGPDCKAVLIDANGGARITVVEGESLDEAVMVQKITPESVTITVRGEARKLEASDQPAHNFVEETQTDSVAALGEALGSAPPSDKALQTLKGQNTPDDGAKSTENSDPIVLDDGTGSAPASTETANGANDQIVNTGLY